MTFKPAIYLLCFYVLERLHIEESQKCISSLKYERETRRKTFTIYSAFHHLSRGWDRPVETFFTISMYHTRIVKLHRLGICFGVWLKIPSRLQTKIRFAARLWLDRRILQVLHKECLKSASKLTYHSSYEGVKGRRIHRYHEEIRSIFAWWCDYTRDAERSTVDGGGYGLPLSLSLSLSLSLHTHTHTHIYIYIYMYIPLSPCQPNPCARC